VGATACGAGACVVKRKARPFRFELHRPLPASEDHDLTEPNSRKARVRAGGPLRVQRARRCSLSQPEDEVAYGRRLGEERVVAGVEFHDTASATGELALQVGGGASVLDADEVRRGCVLPGR
jgi:hypothetical protein